MDNLSEAEYSETWRLLRPDLWGLMGPFDGDVEGPALGILEFGVVGRVGGLFICSGRTVVGEGGACSYPFVPAV